jgi:hypothetical protein
MLVLADSRACRKNDMLDKSVACIYDYARRAGPGGRERDHAQKNSRAPMHRKSPDQAEQKL